MVCLAFVSALAFAAPPADLDGLVSVALERDPEAAALAYEADAARSRADAAGRPMPPQLMLGADALGAPKDSPDPTMLMVGGQQMLRGVGEARATKERIGLDAARSEADRERVAADLRTRLWQLAATVGAEQRERALVDEQIRAAEAVEQIGLARYGAGAGLGPGAGAGAGAGAEGAGAMGGGMPASPMGGSAPPVVRAGPGGGGMGMSGMGGGSSAPAASMGTPGTSAGMGPTTSSGTGAMTSMGGASAGMGGEGLAALLRLDADVARLRADRAGLDADLEGDLAVLRAFVGDEAAEAVAADPDHYLGTTLPKDAPERRLADVDRQAAAASVDVAVARRRPDLMVAVDQRFMPEDLTMPAGTDVSLGVELPLWGSQKRETDAARADALAADARSERVDRDLEVARASARAAWASASARSSALDGSAVPRARQAWDASQALFAADRASADDTVRAWEAWIDVEREALLARRDVELRAAELARVGGE